MSKIICGDVFSSGISGTPDTGVEDKQCPLSSGCNLVSGECVCESKHSCLISFSYSNPEACAQAMKTGENHCDRRTV